MSPFQALYGMPPLSIQAYMPGTTTIHSIDKALQDRDKVLRLLHANLHLTQNRMKQIYDKGCTNREFNVVKAHIGVVAYHLNLPRDSKIHLVFHVSLLNKKIGNAITLTQNLPPIDSTGLLHWQLDKVLDRGMFKKKNAAISKWLIQWTGLPPEEATWEEADEIITHYPYFKH
ncbi:hypothetical protein ACFX1T_007124 [Malus domestica]